MPITVDDSLAVVVEQKPSLISNVITTIAARIQKPNVLFLSFDFLCRKANECR